MTLGTLIHSLSLVVGAKVQEVGQWCVQQEQEGCIGQECHGGEVCETKNYLGS